MWDGVQSQLGTYKRLFGPRLVVVDNDDQPEEVSRQILQKVYRLTQKQLPKRKSVILSVRRGSRQRKSQVTCS